PNPSNTEQSENRKAQSCGKEQVKPHIEAELPLEKQEEPGKHQQSGEEHVGLKQIAPFADPWTQPGFPAPAFDAIGRPAEQRQLCLRQDAAFGLVAQELQVTASLIALVEDYEGRESHEDANGRQHPRDIVALAAGSHV